MTKNHEKAADLAMRYAQNRSEMSAINKEIATLTDWQRADKGVDLSDVRTEYLEEGDRWRGWAYAIELVEGLRDEQDQQITKDQRDLADLLDRKAALRVSAGNIKRSIVGVGRELLKAKP